MMDAVDRYLVENAGRFEQELMEFLRIPSVSADPNRAGDVRRAAGFVADQFRALGLAVETTEIDGRPPVILAQYKAAAANAPTVLVYGHYDVQPPDPLDLWTTGPFEPTVRDGNVYARGATDDKGQMFTHVKAAEAWLKTVGSLPVNVKFLIEGEEEVGSVALDKYLPAHREKLACDYAVVSDTSMFAPDQPAVTYGLKGIAYFELFVDGPRRDLHSGSFGGTVKNPCNALTEMIASLVDADGRILVPGFYDDVVEMDSVERSRMAALPWDEAAYRAEVGVEETFGEYGYTTLERKWSRPTCDVNGIWGGYQGSGAKTVLPAKAGAKFSFRLVPNQRPEKIEAAVVEYLISKIPPGVTARIVPHHGCLPVVAPLDGVGVRAAARALETAFGKPPVFIREGGSIPICSAFKAVLGVDTLLLGFGLSDDNTHSPNEKFSLKDFHRGIRTGAHLFHELSVGG
ncbi:MAG: dipeptidase [Planctomycetia bacterium]